MKPLRYTQPRTRCGEHRHQTPRGVRRVTAFDRKRENCSESAVNKAIHRLRTRYRKCLEAQILAALDNPSELDDEFGSLLEAIRS
jgi:predicted DNA-binding protein (UPF0278 family)